MRKSGYFRDVYLNPDAIHQALLSKGWNMKNLADAISMNSGSLSRLMAKKSSPSEKTLSKICEVLGRKPHEIAQGIAGDIPGAAVIAPVIGGDLLKAWPKTPAPDTGSYISFPGIPENAVAIKAAGEAMAPNIKNKDYLICVPADSGEFKSGDIVIARDEWGEIVVRRIREKGHDLFLVPDNTEFAQGSARDYTLIAKVVKVIRDVAIG